MEFHRIVRTSATHFRVVFLMPYDFNSCIMTPLYATSNISESPARTALSCTAGASKVSMGACRDHCRRRYQWRNRIYERRSEWCRKFVKVKNVAKQLVSVCVMYAGVMERSARPQQYIRTFPFFKVNHTAFRMLFQRWWRLDIASNTLQCSWVCPVYFGHGVETWWEQRIVAVVLVSTLRSRRLA